MRYRNRHDIIVTTGDLKKEYEVLGPVYFQVSNKGLFGSAFGTLKKQYTEEIQAMKDRRTMSADRADWGFLYGEWSVGQNDFEAAFYIATEELKKRALIVGADAVICMRQDIDLDTNGLSYFYLQMYGTAVKFLQNDTASENDIPSDISYSESSVDASQEIQSKKDEKIAKKDYDGWNSWDGTNPDGEKAVRLRPSPSREYFGRCPKCGTEQRLSRHKCWQCGIPFLFEE